MPQVDTAAANAKQIGGGRNLRGGLSECKTELFKGDAGGRARILVVLVAGESEHDVSREANSLKRVGVKIIAIGMGGSYDQFDLSSMANSLSYILTIGKVSDINSLQGSLSTLILQGNCFSSFPLLFLLLFLFFFISICLLLDFLHSKEHIKVF